jgi:hypothetical protein
MAFKGSGIQIPSAPPNLGGIIRGCSRKVSSLFHFLGFLCQFCVKQLVLMAELLEHLSQPVINGNLAGLTALGFREVDKRFLICSHFSPRSSPRLMPVSWLLWCVMLSRPMSPPLSALQSDWPPRRWRFLSCPLGS